MKFWKQKLADKPYTVLEFSYRQDFQQSKQNAWFDKEELQRV